MDRFLPGNDWLNWLQLCVRDHEPFHANRFKIDLHPCLATFSLVLQDDAFAKFCVLDALA